MHSSGLDWNLCWADSGLWALHPVLLEVETNPPKLLSLVFGSILHQATIPYRKQLWLIS